MKKIDNNPRKIRKRGMYTHPMIQARVRAKHARGVRKLAIAREENICISTVTKILTNEQANELVEQANRDFKALGELSVKVLLEQLIKNKDVSLATQVLRSLNVMTTAEDRQIAANVPQQQNTSVNFNNLQLGETGLSLIKQLEENEQRFQPSDRRRELAKVQ